MLLGFGAFGELPISTSGADNSVTIAVTKTFTSESGPDVAKGNADIASNPKLINNP